MSVSRDQVLNFVRQQHRRPLKIRELARALRVSDRAYSDFRRLIRGMVRDGSLVKLRRSRYGIPSEHNLVVGRISVQASGYGLLAPDDGGADIFIGARYMRRARHGDRAVVRLTRRAQGSDRAEGELVRIVERAEQTMVGTYDGVSLVVSDDPRIRARVHIPDDLTCGAKAGQKVVVRLQYSSPNAHPDGQIVEVLGNADDAGIETLILIKKLGLPLVFPQHVLEAVEEITEDIPAEEIDRRLDLRDLTCFTIDPVDARDHDDAVSLQVLDDQTYCLGIHIADVSYYVPEGSPLDHEALSRGSSVYFPDRVIPMLPERLSANICSLQPGEDRLALSILAHITPDGELMDTQIAETVIRSRASLSYEEVQRVLDCDRGAANPAEPYADVLMHMEALRICLTEKRMARGTIDFEIPEPRIILNDQGHPIHIGPRARLNSHRLIEEFMLLANEIVARRMADGGIPILYRVHEPPDGEKLAEFCDLARTLGYRLSNPSRAENIQAFLANFKDEPVGHILSHRLLRSMKKAVYTPENVGHFGLACDTYTHFTSPIRRYPDLILHRILRDAINDGSTPGQMARRARRLPDIGDLATQREIAAQQAEWDAIRLMQILYLKDKMGECFDAVIVDVRSIGFFVQLNDVLIEGLVHVKNLWDDYYIYHELQGALVGESTGTTFRLGDSVQVQLAQLDQQRLRIDFHLLSHTQNDRPKGSRKRRGRR
ncbi:MAG: ribonuclease R [Gemmatimonadetes bacterium]|nr:ribonuclease R [Gemmatimonadota bacterium]